MKIPDEELDDWGALQLHLDNVEDIRDKIAFLQTLVSQNKFSCAGSKAAPECVIFKDVRDLRKKIANLPPGLTSKTGIEAATRLNPLQRKDALQEYERLAMDCDDTLQKIMSNASKNKAIFDIATIEQQWRMDLIKEMNRSKLPIPLDAGKAVESFLQGTSSLENWEESKKEQKDRVKQQDEGKTNENQRR